VGLTRADRLTSVRLARMTRPTPDQRKSTILDAVVQVIIDVGFTQMTVADVARRAGVSTALVHYHFASKAALITAALKVASDEDKQLRDSVANGPGSALARLDEVVCGTLPASKDDASWLLWIETWGETRRIASIRDVMEELNDHELAVFVRLIGEGVAAGEFLCSDPERVASRLSATRDGLAIQKTLFNTSNPASEFVAQMRGSIQHELELSDRDSTRLTVPR
jgi:AcrR family transcriptional regulator